jgi:hypothetical protein
MICQQLEPVFPHYSISCCAEIIPVVPRKGAKAVTQRRQSGHEQEASASSRADATVRSMSGSRAILLAVLACLPSLNSVEDYGVPSL